MKYLSVCSGIEAATVAWHPLGWECVGVAEIDPFACSVLKHHYPNVRNYGNLNDYASWDIAPGAVDVLVGGTPCQSFSVSGLRKGLADPRGNLALVYLGLVDRIRPRYLVWENVPGVLSSGGGRDFGAFLGALVELGYGFAYRVLDAQWVRVDGHPRAVPQRRRRVFVVGCAGADWQRAAEVLLEPEGLRVCAPTRLTIKKDDSAEACPSSLKRGNDSGVEWPSSVSPTLDSMWGDRAPHTINQEWLSTAGGKFVPDALVGALAVPRVRRITPRECERLQGFPDDYTLVAHKGKPAADGNRYKALGNSMAVNVMRWIGARISSREG